jgi:hypothetical protein
LRRRYQAHRQLKYYFNLRTGTGNITAKVWSADVPMVRPVLNFSAKLSQFQRYKLAYPNATTVTLPPLSITGDYYIGYQIAYAGSDAVSLITNGRRKRGEHRLAQIEHKRLGFVP